MVHVVWEFVARADRLQEFESAYANSGAWAQLFRKSGGFHGTTLLRDAGDSRRYLTIDRWQSSAAQQQMRERFASEYEALDRACESLTESERRVGVFEEM
ncbi:MAG TPA: antibiotic biosynthesis monooxygenase [Verrucomicrobiae bacterium]|nr:antibiotic biosynthesis monooxygenase [Verrucomicrobiae bacterium]